MIEEAGESPPYGLMIEERGERPLYGLCGDGSVGSAGGGGGSVGKRRSAA
jgi:hypothetical protein